MAARADRDEGTCLGCHARRGRAARPSSHRRGRPCPRHRDRRDGHLPHQLRPLDQRADCDRRSRRFLVEGIRPSDRRHVPHSGRRELGAGGARRHRLAPLFPPPGVCRRRRGAGQHRHVLVRPVDLRLLRHPARDRSGERPRAPVSMGAGVADRDCCGSGDRRADWVAAGHELRVGTCRVHGGALVACLSRLQSPMAMVGRPFAGHAGHA